jgi:hypothetical protein
MNWLQLGANKKFRVTSPHIYVGALAILLKWTEAKWWSGNEVIHDQPRAIYPTKIDRSMCR